MRCCYARCVKPHPVSFSIKSPLYNSGLVSHNECFDDFYTRHVDRVNTECTTAFGLLIDATVLSIPAVTRSTECTNSLTTATQFRGIRYDGFSAKTLEISRILFLMSAK